MTTDQMQCEYCDEMIAEGGGVSCDLGMARMAHPSYFCCDDCADEAREEVFVANCEAREYEALDFAVPGGDSALRAATRSNPRNLPCPTCGGENLLTPADRARGYQCDGCADQAERGW